MAAMHGHVSRPSCSVLFLFLLPALGADASAAVHTDSSGYRLVFRQTAPKTFTAGELHVHASDSSADNFAQLDQMESFRNEAGVFELKLGWPGKKDLLWKQKSNPVEETGGVHGFEAVDDQYDSFGWGGLRSGQDSDGLLVGAAPHSETQTMTLGSFSLTNKGLHHPDGSTVQRVELWAKPSVPQTHHAAAAGAHGSGSHVTIAGGHKSTREVHGAAAIHIDLGGDLTSMPEDADTAEDQGHDAAIEHLGLPTPSPGPPASLESMPEDTGAAEAQGRHKAMASISAAAKHDLPPVASLLNTNLLHSGFGLVICAVALLAAHHGASCLRRRQGSRRMCVRPVGGNSVERFMDVEDEEELVHLVDPRRTQSVDPEVEPETVPLLNL